MRTTIALLAIGLSAALLLFQNCGQGLQAASWTGNNNSASLNPPPTGPAPVNPGNTTFAKDEAFNYASVPLKTQMLQTQVESLNYATFTGAKAIGINQQGLGFVARIAAPGTQAQANQIALEGCFAIGGGLPCALLAVADKFEVSSAALPVSYTFSIPAPTGINAASIPFVNPGVRAALATAFNAAASPKVLALSVDGAYDYVSAGDMPAVTSVAEARRVALERCEMTAAYPPCSVFAENAAVVFNPAAMNRVPAIDFTKTVLMTSVPGMKDAHFNQYIQGYLTSVNGTDTFGAIYLAGDGAGGFSYGPTAATADANAKNFCDTGVGTPGACFKYAVNKTVQNFAAGIVSMKSFPMVNCKSIPRVNCAAHKALGCAAGMSYTMNGTMPALENCL